MLRSPAPGSRRVPSRRRCSPRCGGAGIASRRRWGSPATGSTSRSGRSRGRASTSASSATGRGTTGRRRRAIATGCGSGCSSISGGASSAYGRRRGWRDQDAEIAAIEEALAGSRAGEPAASGTDRDTGAPASRRDPASTPGDAATGGDGSRNPGTAPAGEPAQDVGRALLRGVPPLLRTALGRPRTRYSTAHARRADPRSRRDRAAHPYRGRSSIGCASSWV